MHENVELKDISGFIQIARAGSLTRAARETNIPKATLSHSLRRLEDTLEVELFTRSVRGLTLTDAGKAYLDNCKRIFHSCEVAASAAQRAHSSVSGRIRIAASNEFGTSILGAATLFLAQEHPGLDFEVRMYPSDILLTDYPDFDCLISVGTAPDSSYLCRKMGTVSYGIYGSQELVESFGMPSKIEDVKKMPGVEYSRSGLPEEWSLQGCNCEQSAKYTKRFSVHDYWMAKYYAVSGVALAYLPNFFVHYEVDQGSLVHILPELCSSEISVWVIYPMSRHKNPRVKLMVDTLCSKFEEFILHPGYSLVPQVRLK
ncbi:LysR family transcriptional regulator [Leisingera sp.]|uniref:LysR family transcriptional regulator n=1 Tax=Leisingera sp. TaxID=1879318 RepID=UPI002B26C9FE|nr:LysR family transcriptional regulator [Leisingera sp.]